MKFAGVVYLTKEIVMEIHSAQIAEHGGMPGVRDHAGLESAISQPKSSFGGEDLYPTIFDKAATYAFHLAESQAFVDGNKRVGLACALTFLALNGIEFDDDQPDFFDAMLAIANRTLDKEGLSEIFRQAWLRQIKPQ